MANDEHRPTSKEIPGQTLSYPASQEDMKLKPDSDLSNYRPADKLRGKVAIITGGDSGIGRAVAIAFAMEGADVAIIYNEHDDDAAVTKKAVESKGRRCVTIKTDVRLKDQCAAAVAETVKEFGKINIMVNNAAYQMAQQKFEDITEEQLRKTFETNIYGYFFMAQAVVPHLTKDDSIINTGSIVGFEGNEILIDYSSTKGAIHTFTKALAANLGEKGIRVNSVAPGPVWTPAIPAGMPKEEIKKFGGEVALARPGQPEELAPAYVFLASEDGSFVTGSIVQVTGGKKSSG